MRLRTRRLAETSMARTLGRTPTGETKFGVEQQRLQVSGIQR